MSEAKSSKDSKPNQEGHFSESIFTPEETISLLKGFINAWLRGKINVHFPSAREIMSDENASGRTISKDEADKQETDQYDNIEKLIQTVMGTTPSTKEERQFAISALIQFVVRWRAIERMEGTFDTVDTERKLDELIEKVDAIGRAFEAFVNWLRGL